VSRNAARVALLVAAALALAQAWRIAAGDDAYVTYAESR
jgi:hypothetical protein